MKIIFENCDIANATDNAMLSLIGVMKMIATSTEKATEEPMEKKPEPVKEESKAEVKRPEPKKETVKKEAAEKKPEPKKEEVKPTAKPAESKPQANPPAPKEQDESKQQSEPVTEEATPQVNRADVINLGKTLVKNGKAKEVNALMKEKYKATKFSDISDEQLPEVYKAFKEIENE